MEYIYIVCAYACEIIFLNAYWCKLPWVTCLLGRKKALSWCCETTLLFIVKAWPNPTLEKQCVGVCVNFLGCMLRNHWHYWRLTELLFWTYRRPATQICDLEGHDKPLSVRGICFCLSVYVWKITTFIYFLANENHSTCKQWRILEVFILHICFWVCDCKPLTLWKGGVNSGLSP